VQQLGGGGFGFVVEVAGHHHTRGAGPGGRAARDVRADGGGFGSAAVEGVAIEDGSPQSCDTIRDAKLREWMGFMVAAVVSSCWRFRR
jgi:hypothetical protein